MPAQIKCKLCSANFTSLHLDHFEAAKEIGMLFTLHMQNDHVRELTDYIRNYVMPSMGVYQGLACQTRFSELTPDEYNNPSREAAKSAREKVIAVLDGNPEKIEMKEGRVKLV